MPRRTTPDDLLRPAAAANVDELTLVFGVAEETAGGWLQEVDVDLIDDNPYQPRVEYVRIEELAAEIQAEGLLQPPRGRRMPDGRVQLQYGHRRLRAVKLLGWTTISMEVQAEISDEVMAARAWSENHGREDFTAMDQARYFRLLVDAGWTQKAIAGRLRLSEPTVSNTLRLLRLPEEVQAEVAEGKISQRQAEALVPVFSFPAEMQAAAEQATSKWYRPSELVKTARNGTSSDVLRNYSQSLVREITQEIPEHWGNRVFGGGDYQAATCTACGKKYNDRCYVLECWRAKSSAWQAIENANIVTQTGAQLAPEDNERFDRGTMTLLFRHERALLEAAGKMPKGASPCENIRLSRRSFDKLPGSDMGFICHHPGKKTCSCLMAANRQANKASQVIWKATLEDTQSALAAALDDIPLPMLRLLASVHAHQSDLRPESVDERLPADRSVLTAKIVSALIKQHAPWEPEKNGEEGRKRMESMLILAGITPPWRPNSGALHARLDEIQAFLDDFINPGDGTPTPLAIRRVLDDLNQIHDAAGQFDADEAQKLKERYSFLWGQAIALNERVEQSYAAERQ